MKNKIFSRGFTLAELMVSISIITILIVAGMNYFVNSLKKARDAERKSDLNQIAIALEMYRRNNMANGGYPSIAFSLDVEKYINDRRVAQDPFESAQYHYAYSKVDPSSYLLGAMLEGENNDPTTSCSALGISLDCGLGAGSCNYCLVKP